MTLLRIGYVVDAIVTAPIALAMLCGHASWVRRLLDEALPDDRSLQVMLGALWTALFVCLVLGAMWPVTMAPVLLLQLIYKSLWMLGYAIPRWTGRRSGAVSVKVAGLFVAYIAVYPWIIPWSRLFAAAR